MAGRLIALLLMALAPAVVAAGAWIAFVEEDDAGPFALVAVADPARPAHAAPPEPAGEPSAAPEATGLDISLAGVDAFHVHLRKPPSAGLLFDVGSGEVLWRLHPTRVRSIASLTKIMTALLAVEEGRPREPVRITRAALDYEGSAIGMLRKGTRVRFETLLNGLLIVSGNDAAIALATHLAGSEAAFVDEMNERAEQLGLRCTHFVSSHGLEPGNRSCARDLAVLTRLAMRRARIRRIAATEYAELPFPTKGGKLYLSGHNYLQRLDYPGAIGLKTGYTDEAGRCYVGVVRRGGRTLAVILLNSRDPAGHAPKLLNAASAAR